MLGCNVQVPHFNPFLWLNSTGEREPREVSLREHAGLTSPSACIRPLGPGIIRPMHPLYPTPPLPQQSQPTLNHPEPLNNCELANPSLIMYTYCLIISHVYALVLYMHEHCTNSQRHRCRGLGLHAWVSSQSPGTSVRMGAFSFVVGAIAQIECLWMLAEQRLGLQQYSAFVDMPLVQLDSVRVTCRS